MYICIYKHINRVSTVCVICFGGRADALLFEKASGTALSALQAGAGGASFSLAGTANTRPLLAQPVNTFGVTSGPPYKGYLV